MPDIQTNVSDEALVTAIRANMCEFFLHLSRSDPAKHYENGNFTRWYTGMAHPWFNGILCSALPEQSDESFIDESIKYFREKRTRVFTWWMETHLKRSDWEPLLSKHGFGFSDDTPGMAVDLHELNEPGRKTDGTLEIRVVDDEASARTWAHIFTLGYGLPPDWESLIFDVWIKLGLNFPLRNYLGYLNDEPVGTSSLFLGGGVAGIYSVATLLESRGKGIGAALTYQPLLDAREMGYRIGVLQSSEMGFNVYKGLGFRHLCQIENFYLAT